MNGKLALLLGLGVTGLILLALSMTTGRHGEKAVQAAPRPSTAASRPPSPPGTTSPSPMADQVERLLPFTTQQVADAAHLAARFTAAYASHRYDETRTAYLAKLAPMMSAQLRPIIARAAADAATLDRRRHHDITVAQVDAETIRSLAPSSITFQTTTTSQTTTDETVRRQTTRYAVTLIRDQDGWRVFAIELAATGDAGDLGADTP